MFETEILTYCNKENKLNKNAQCNSPLPLSQTSCPCWGGGKEDPETEKWTSA